MDGYIDPAISRLSSDDLGSGEAGTVDTLDELVAPVPGRGTFFDEHLDIRDPEGTAFTAQVLEICDAVRPRQRRRNRRALDSHTTRVRKLLANAIRGCWYREHSAVPYFRKADAEWYVGKPRWMRHGAMARAVDALSDAGLVQAIIGKRMPPYSATPSWASSFTATEKLKALAADCGVSEKSVARAIPSVELVQLFGPKLGQARKGEPIEFEPTAETRRWTAALEAINSFYRQQVIALDFSPDELAAEIAKHNADPERAEIPLRLPETFRTDIYRVFNNGVAADPRFDEGGRLAGGWWMSVLSHWRAAITINGRGTVELDYAACHPRMLYHERGLDVDGDLYTLPEITAYEEAIGVAPDTYRGYVKWLMQVMINGKGRPQAVDTPAGIKIPVAFTVNEMSRLIEAKHHPIADSFGTAAGTRLMKLESDIALAIVSAAVAEGWTILPVHDSFVVADDQRERLMAAMISAYRQRFGREPVIK